MENKLERMEEILLGWMEFLYGKITQSPDAYDISDVSKYLAEVGKVELEVRCYLEHSSRSQCMPPDKILQD